MLMEVNFTSVLEQLSEAQETCALLDCAMDMHAKLEQPVCSKCLSDIMDIKIMLDGAYTNLRDLLGLPKEDL